MKLCEKYRPKEWVDFIGQEKVVRRIRGLIERPGFGDGVGEAFWVSGPTGTGKTILAQLVSRSLGVKPGPAWNYTELDGDKCNVEQVRSLDDRTRAAGLFCEWQVFVVNEAHAMSGRAIQAWLTLLERLPERWIVIFTTTKEPDESLFGEFTDPLLSRCKVYQFTNQGLAKKVAEYCKGIARDEGLDGQPLERYIRLVQSHHNSVRATMQDIDDGKMLD